MTPKPPLRVEPLGRRVARLRAGRSWTQEQLAERLAVSRAAVSHLEAGLSTPSERTVVLLAGLFRLEPNELVEDTNYPDAKRDRLPHITCRYTEAEQQIVLLNRDLEWMRQLAPHADKTMLARCRILVDERIYTMQLLRQQTDDRDTCTALDTALSYARAIVNGTPG